MPFANMITVGDFSVMEESSLQIRPGSRRKVFVFALYI